MSRVAIVLALALMAALVVARPAFAAIFLSPTSLPPGTVSTPYNQAILANDGNDPDDVSGPFDNDDVFTYTVTAGAIPPGLTLNFFNGVLSGTPTAGGSFSFTVTATDLNNATGTQDYTLIVGTNSLALNPPTLPNGTQGIQYNQTVTASGGTGPYTYSVAAGSLPAGLSLNPNSGALTGIPTGSGSSSFTIQALDTVGNIGSQAYTINIGTASLTVNPASLPAGTQGVPYNQTVSAIGGTGPYTFSITSGSLPAGLLLNAGSGAINGTPTSTGQSLFTVQAVDTNGNTGNRSYALNIGTNSLTVAPASLPNGTQGTPYSQTFSASGGNGSYTFAVTAGSLPAGLSLSSGGVLSGTPTGSGPSSFTVQAMDSIGDTGSQNYSINIGTNSLAVNPASLPPGTQGVAYSQTVSASGGAGPYTYAVSAGALPAGLALNASTGAITGTPTSGGPASFSIRALDTLGNTGTRAYSMNVGTASLTINPAALQPAVVGKPYVQALVASGGTGPYTFSVTAGALPPGLTLNGSTGAITGVPQTPGSASFTVQALDSVGDIGSRAYSLTNRPDPALDPEVIGLVNAQVQVARRFATAQIDNLTRHLESLHDRFDECLLDFGVTLPPPADDRASPYSVSPGNAARSYEPNSPAGQIARRMSPSPDCADNGGRASALAFWLSGAVQFGSVAPDGLVVNSKFTTSGLTAGLDWRVIDNLTAGFALGYGTDATKVGSYGTRSDSTTLTAMLFASYKPFDAWFVDTLAGYGGLDYDTRRWVTDDRITVSGGRKGSYWFGAVSTGYDARFDALRLSPYVRADFMSAKLNAYSEQGSSAELLTYGSMGFHTVAGALGLRGSYDIPVSWGVLTPTARAEYRRALDGSFQQSMYYSDLGPSVTSILSQNSATRSMVNTSLGIRAHGLAGMNAELDYGTSSSGGRLQSQTIRAALKLPF